MKMKLKLKLNSILAVVLSFLFCIFSPCNVMAASNTVSVKTIYFSDGSYFETTIIESPVKASGTRTGTKTSSYKNGDGKTMWDISVKGTFSYTGTSSTCTSSTVSANSYDSNWKIADKSASKSGNKASGTVTAKQYYLLTCINTMTKTVNLYCDKNGVLS